MQVFSAKRIILPFSEWGWSTMRDTAYATEQISATLPLDDGEHEARIERIFVKDEGEEEIRFSWWKNGNIVPRPLDLDENTLLDLFQRRISAGVFTANFRNRLRGML